MTAFEGDLQEELVLRFSHNVLEHLGLKLYQNKPTNVLAELVSNSWDAYAKHFIFFIRKFGTFSNRTNEGFSSLII